MDRISYSSTADGQYYMTDFSTRYQLKTMQLHDRSDNFWDRADVFDIFGICTIIVCFVLFCINAVSALVEKGGVWKN